MGAKQRGERRIEERRRYESTEVAKRGTDGTAKNVEAYK